MKLVSERAVVDLDEIVAEKDRTDTTRPLVIGVDVAGGDNAVAMDTMNTERDAKVPSVSDTNVVKEDVKNGTVLDSSSIADSCTGTAEAETTDTVIGIKKNDDVPVSELEEEEFNPFA